MDSTSSSDRCPRAWTGVRIASVVRSSRHRRVHKLSLRQSRQSVTSIDLRVSCLRITIFAGLSDARGATPDPPLATPPRQSRRVRAHPSIGRRRKCLCAGYRRLRQIQTAAFRDNRGLRGLTVARGDRARTRRWESRARRARRRWLPRHMSARWKASKQKP